MSICRMREKCLNPATALLCSPDGTGIGYYCKEHAESAIREYRDKLGEEWTVEEAS